MMTNATVAVRCFAICLLCVLASSPLFAAEETFRVTVAAGKHDRSNAPAKIPLLLPADLAKSGSVSLTDADGNALPGQLTAPSLLSKAAVKGDATACELHFIVPSLKSGASLELTAVIAAKKKPAGKSFAWADQPGKFAELSFAGRPVLRYMCEPLDESTKERRMETYKVYHHVYDPRGERFVTKGPGGLFPHHRGLFFGFNRISYGQGKRADIWHCSGGTHQSHEGFVSGQTGPVLGRHVVAVDWHGQGKEVFAKEQRELTVYNTPGGLLIEFASVLTSTAGKVTLDGDPQHAGFQFRGSQEIPDKTSKLTYYLRPDGKDKPGSFRNWPGNKDHVNLPWNALSFVLGEQRYTCCYLDRPENPKEARFSERNYGRFGSYFKYEMDEGKPLELNYRIWLQEGEMTVEGIRAISDNFVDPVTAVVKEK